MRNIIVKKIALQSSTDSEKFDSYACVRIDHTSHSIEWVDCGGKAPLYWSFISFLANDKDAREELIWAATEYHRKNFAWVEQHVGQHYPHATTTKVKVSRTRIPDWALGINGVGECVLRLHISCFDKLNEGVPQFMFAGDLLDVLAYLESEDELCNLIKYGMRKQYKYMPYRKEEVNYAGACGRRSREFFSRKNEGN